MDKEALQETLLQLIEDYHDVTPSSIEVYNGPLDSTAFGRLVMKGRPCIIKNALPDLAASSWTSSVLRQKMGDRKVDVAVTPNGLADAIVDNTYFLEPYTTSLPFSHFLDILGTTAEGQSSNETSTLVPILYLQSQNDNLRLPPTSTNDLTPLYPDVLEPDYASTFFDKSPEAINIWIGDERSVTSLHRDSSYHNLYTVVRGAKKFTMFAPFEESLLYEKEYIHATYTTSRPGSTTDGQIADPEISLTSMDFEIQPTVPTIKIPWPSVNPLTASRSPNIKEYPLFAYARPIVAVLERGDTLYMPPAWFHTVQQRSQQPDGASSDDEAGDASWEPCIALNWWYDREIGHDWAIQGMLGKLSRRVHDRLRTGSESP